MSFLEMLDVVNERLINEGEEPITFDHDCREGICGTCSLMINGQAHGPQRGTATCQLHMRKFDDGDTIVDRAVAGRAPSRSSRTSWSTARRFDRIVEAGGFITAPTGGAPDANLILDPEAGGRRGDGRRRVHRLRRLRGRLPERGRQPVHRGQGRATSTCCPRASPSATAASRRWSTRWRSTSAPARTTASARRRARRRSRSTSSRSMNKDYLKAKVKNRRYLSRT